jgi:hypothetical protein
MTQNNGSRSNHATPIIEDQDPPQVNASTVQTEPEAKAELATRANCAPDKRFNRTGS